MSCIHQTRTAKLHDAVAPRLYRNALLNDGRTSELAVLPQLAFDGDANAHLEVVSGLAEGRGVKIDIHLRQPGQRGIEQLCRIAARTAAVARQGMVVVNYAYAVADVDQDEASRIADILAEAEIAIMANGDAENTAAAAATSPRERCLSQVPSKTSRIDTVVPRYNTPKGYHS